MPEIEKNFVKIKKIVLESATEKECIKKLTDNKLVVSTSQGRRYWYGLKKI